MKKIPAVTETIIVKPEQIIYEVGDRVKCYDNSYLLKLEISGYFLVWSGEQKDGIFGKYVTIVDLNLRVPVMNRSNMRQELDRGNPVYLDTMVKDENGDLYLTKLKFLYAS